jgi:carboxylesterase
MGRHTRQILAPLTRRLRQIQNDFAGQLWGDGPTAEINEAGRNPALLAIHGFGSTPNEVYLLCAEARPLGLRLRAPLLPGHGTSAAALAKTRYSDWYAAAEREFLKLTETGPVVVGGQSMGAVIALDLASNFPASVVGVVALANATRMTGPYPDLALALASKLRVPDFMMPKFGGPDIADIEQKAHHRTYSSQPMHAAFSLRDAGLRVLEQLSRITCPVFIAHGRHDHVCPVENAWRVADKLGSQDVEVMLLPRSRHIVTKDVDRVLLARRIRRFLERVEGVGTAQ